MLDFQEINSRLLQTIGYIFSFTHLYKLTVSVFIFAIFLLFKRLFAKYIFYFLMKLCSRTDLNSNGYILQAFQNPIKHLMVLAGAYFALKNYLPATFGPVLDNLYSSAIVVFLARGLIELIEIYAHNQAEIKQLFNKEVDEILIPFFAKMFKAIVIILAFVVIASKWGYDVNGFIAGLGLGGLAMALAAKDLLANIFSGIVIITDKPFNIGDWIKTNDLEGTVLDINFRSTRIKQFDESLVTIPNSTLVNAPITNFTKRTMRRITFNLKIKYNTSSEQLKKCVARIEALLLEHPKIDNRTIFVKFDSFGDSSLNIFIYFFTNTIIWDEYLNIKQDVNFRIMDILEDEGVKVGLPGTSVYMETPLTMKNDDK